MIVGGIATGIQLRRRPSRDQIRTLYARFCRKAARLGARRELTEGPIDFSRRAAALLPFESDRIARIAQCYVELRYAPGPRAFLLQQLAKEVHLFGAAERVDPRIASGGSRDARV